MRRQGKHFVVKGSKWEVAVAGSCTVSAAQRTIRTLVIRRRIKQKNALLFCTVSIAPSGMPMTLRGQASFRPTLVSHTVSTPNYLRSQYLATEEDPPPASGGRGGAPAGPAVQKVSAIGVHDSLCMVGEGAGVDEEGRPLGLLSRR